jgi:hypothetical protein
VAAPGRWCFGAVAGRCGCGGVVVVGFGDDVRRCDGAAGWRLAAAQSLPARSGPAMGWAGRVRCGYCCCFWRLTGGRRSPLAREGGEAWWNVAAAELGGGGAAAHFGWCSCRHGAGMGCGPSWCPPHGAVPLSLGRQAGHLLLRWPDGGWRWLRVAWRLTMALGAVWTSGQRPRDGGCGMQFGCQDSGPGTVGVARSTSACGATVGFVGRRRRPAKWGWPLRLGGLASTTWVWVNSARKHCIDLGRRRRCRRPWTTVPLLEASSRSSPSPPHHFESQALRVKT